MILYNVGFRLEKSVSCLGQGIVEEEKQVCFQYVKWKCDYQNFGVVEKLLKDENERFLLAFFQICTNYHCCF